VRSHTASIPTVLCVSNSEYASGCSQRELWVGRAQSVEVACPRLHHSSTLRQTLRAIVGAAAFVPFGMRELQLDQN
jgi:hypothetical protein